MVAVFALLAAFGLLVAAILLLQEARSMRSTAQEPIYVIEDAVRFIHQKLPATQRERLTLDDVRCMLEWQLQFVRQLGPAGNGTRARTPTSEPLIIGGTQAAAFIMLRAEEGERSFSFEDIHAVLDAESHYLHRIGGIGRPVKPRDAGGRGPAGEGEEG